MFQLLEIFDLATMSFTFLKPFLVFFSSVCGDFKEAKDIVALQRADRVHEVIVHKHIVGICSIQSEGLASELC